jgi:DNA-binding GntR family transcriptional regulator
MEQLIKKGKPLHLQSYELLKASIVSGDYLPGERLTEASLSKELGVSRATIRESLKMLQQDGLIDYDKGSLKVITPDWEMANSLYLCRERLESLAARLLAESVTEETSERLREIIDLTEKALAEKDIPNIVKLNTDFHHTIIEECGNKELTTIMRMVRAKVTFIRNSLHTNYFRQDNYLDEHREVCEAICQKDPEKAEQAMSRHLKNDLQAVKILFNKTEE